MNDADRKAFDANAFEAWWNDYTSKIDLFSDEWQDKTVDDHSKEAWQAACEWRNSQVGEPYAYIYEFDSKQFGVHRSFSSNQWNGLNPSRCVLVYTTPPAAQINRQLLEALEAAVACGMVPSMSARSGGACAHVEQLKVADQIRDALAAAKGVKNAID